MRILVIDDEVPITEMLEEHLRRRGHQVDVANTGAAGLERARLTAYDALVLDVRMPVMTGVTVFETLRTEGLALADRTVFVCADLTPSLLAQLDRLGQPVLAKPFALPVLLRTVESVASGT